MYDGYVTVDFGAWHFHLCIGEHTASGPDFGRLAAWDALRERYLGLGPDPRDRSGTGFRHG
ncbi:hypothetical protein MXD62_37195 [Frankia sp. Mgl5]|nr:hypothetical protein [Frankia sp. Mgl5]MCK9932713.1 hypothetical protein [Frankia sp. Mgl5]